MEAAAIGSSRGWSIAPTSIYNDQKLRYPIGISDLAYISDKKLNIIELKKAPMIIYMGEENNNDSVIFKIIMLQKIKI